MIECNPNGLHRRCYLRKIKILIKYISQGSNLCKYDQMIGNEIKLLLLMEIFVRLAIFDLLYASQLIVNYFQVS